MAHAIILMNLGTPAEPTPGAVRAFLREFLSDTRVVEIPKPVWQLILNLFILPLRPKRIAPAYAEIWDSGLDGEPVSGSPIMFYTRRQAELLQARLQPHDSVAGDETGGGNVMVTYAMTYGAPNLADTVERLRQEGAKRFTLVPLYPQYSATTTGAIYDQVARIIRTSRDVPDISVVHHYWEHPGYIAALANSVREHWHKHGQAEKLMMSFHGIPKANTRKGDPYYHHCCGTAERLAEALGLSRERWEITFQSRFGKAEWLQPYTDKTLIEWGRNGVASVDVLCPAFSADCLETLEEIAVENRANFIDAGGREYRYIPALNTREDHIAMLEAIVRERISDLEAG
ncbi:ferrochelatase [Microbulbifer salipaludis]|uniref:Ferrochelatase n=1 Tax=Microbulbifer salipaludis TaxID=187980 RepID=A0ABS3E787_9GAMM|nr:ferrochelatase [Microbulbifer salipaludis]MBN8431193.1 ferrochelatase [Microbulbifer salipaludis]